LVVMSLFPFACSRTISISGAKGGSHASTSLIASRNPPGLDAIPGQKALTSDHKRVLWCASSASRLRSGTLRLYKAGLQKRLVLVATSFSDAVAPFWLRFIADQTHNRRCGGCSRPGLVAEARFTARRLQVGHIGRVHEPPATGRRGSHFDP
jgi:hypothetical protein